jgi:uncharacterized membrane protein
MEEARLMEATQAETQVPVRRQPAPPGQLNVGESERWASLAGGAVLALLGMRRGGALGLLLGGAGAALVYRGASGHCPVYQQLGINSATEAGRPVHLRTVVTVNRDPQSLYAFWRDFTRLPLVMRILAEVSPERDGRSHWVAKAPRLEWDSEVTADVPGERIAWRSLEGSQVDSRGEVRFRAAPQGRGTEVELELQYRPPGGAAGAAVARFLSGASEQVLKEDLRRFKRLMESGEIPTSDMTVH